MTPIIDLGLDSLVDISCMQGYTSTKHSHLHLGGTYYTRLSEGSTHRERCKSSNSELNKNEQRSIACGGEFKVKVGYMLGGRR